MSDEGVSSTDMQFESSNGELDHVLLCPRIDRVFDSLCHHRRRSILVLLNHGIVDTEADVIVRGGDETAANDISLVHSHLPKLAEAGYIDWNRETGEIWKGPRFEEVEPLLDLIETHADELPPDWP